VAINGKDVMKIADREFSPAIIVGEYDVCSKGRSENEAGEESGEEG